jgi:hypothetical protein
MLEWGEGSADDADDVVFAHVQEILPVQRIPARALAEQHAVTDLTPIETILPLSSVLPGPA